MYLNITNVVIYRYYIADDSKEFEIEIAIVYSVGYIALSLNRRVGFEVYIVKYYSLTL